VNDYTPLHYAASQNDPRAIELLVSNGADLNARTGIDDFATPLEEAQNLNCFEAVKILKSLSI
jgi:ankyrin repeat protein